MGSGGFLVSSDLGFLDSFSEAGLKKEDSVRFAMALRVLEMVVKDASWRCVNAKWNVGDVMLCGP